MCFIKWLKFWTKKKKRGPQFFYDFIVDINKLNDTFYRLNEQQQPLLVVMPNRIRSKSHGGIKDKSSVYKMQNNLTD